jgi:hypothetical protein
LSAKSGATGVAPAHVVLTGGLSRRYTGGVQEFDIEAKNLRGVIKAMDQLYPGLGAHLEVETSVAIDGEIHDDVGYYQPVRPGSQIFFIPKLEGG